MRGILIWNRKYTTAPIEPWFCLYLQEHPLRWKVVPWGTRRPTRLQTQTEDFRHHRLTLPTVRPDHHYRSSEPCQPRPNPILGLTEGVCALADLRRDIPGARALRTNLFHKISCGFFLLKLAQHRAAPFGRYPHSVGNPGSATGACRPPPFRTFIPQLTVQYQVFSAQIKTNQHVEILL